jgi:hypothetical protein
LSVRSIVLLVAAFVLGALAFAGYQRLGAPTEVQTGCAESASRVWETFRVEASSSGASCARAVLTLVVRGRDGAALWVDSAPGAQLMTFANVKTRSEMAKALGEWLDQSPSFDNTAELLPWNEGAEQPSGEFPFYPDQSVDRTYYEGLRAAKLPMFCYVQGMESLACIVLKDGRVTKIGVQSFPG